VNKCCYTITVSTRAIAFSEYEFYHVYNRGTDKRVIYQNHQDHQRFIELLFLANSSKSFNVRDVRTKYENVFEYDRGQELVAIGAYCLMPNHFHLLVTPLIEGGVAKFMSKLSTGYSMYFNKKYNRTGSLFEGSFKAKHADSDEYLKYLFSYIHLNPTKLQQPDWEEQGSINEEATFDFVKSYRYSSLVDYLGENRVISSVLKKASFPEYFSNEEALKSEIFSWLTFKNSP
jgi:putative transposase